MEKTMLCFSWPTGVKIQTCPFDLLHFKNFCMLPVLPVPILNTSIVAHILRGILNVQVVPSLIGDAFVNIFTLSVSETWLYTGVTQGVSRNTDA